MLKFKAILFQSFQDKPIFKIKFYLKQNINLSKGWEVYKRNQKKNHDVKKDYVKVEKKS